LFASFAAPMAESDFPRANVDQHSDPPREYHDKGRLQSVYSSTGPGSENHNGSWR
jgi:hypothetical protein